jgi:hypothetical protein
MHPTGDTTQVINFNLAGVRCRALGAAIFLGRWEEIMRAPVRLPALICVVLITARSPFAANNPRKIDEYGAITCEDEMARLDNYAVELQSGVSTRAVVIVYGGRRGTRRDEVRARMAYARHYLAVNRGIDRGRIKVFNGGFREHLTTELYIIPAGADATPLISPTASGKDVRFKRGKVGDRIRACSGIG